MLFSSTFIVSALFAASALAVPTQVDKRQAPAAVEPPFPSGTYAGESYGNEALITALLNAPLQADRVGLLKDQDFKFSFRQPPGKLNVATGNGE